MITHALACGMGCESASTSNVVWTFVTLTVILAIGGILVERDSRRRRAGLPPREPLTDMSPLTRSLLAGRNVPGYTAPVRAVTPGGITVRSRRCCNRIGGHQTPAQAVACAQRTAWGMGKPESNMITVLAGARISSIVCPDCQETFPVEVDGAWHGTLDDQIDAALAGVSAQHPDHGAPVTIRDGGDEQQAP